MGVEATLLGRPHVFERGEKLYITTPVTAMSPSTQQIEEFAFASAVKHTAPNENIGWLQGRYVEANRPNLNNAMWLSDELALKSLTPMLMPVTVMHDPRVSVGVIADCKLVQELGSNARIDNVLGIWKHRYPEVWEEAEYNVGRGELMESMECFTPWYVCSECSQQYIKLPHGAEQASWCNCLRTNSGRRILGDVCFTGTGLIFGSRGGKGAYTDAFLDHFQDEIAAYHEQVHFDSTYRPNRSATVGLVQIEETELATLRRERDEAKTLRDQLQGQNRELTTKTETAEAALRKAEEEKAAADKKVKDLEDEKAGTALRDTRLAALGTGFMAKLGDTSKSVLSEAASKVSDEEWDRALKEREELAGVKRDEQVATPPGTPPAGGPPAGGGSEGTGFKSEEVAAFMRSGVTAPAGSTSTPPDGATSVRSLARSFAKRKQPASQK